ncbi:MAG: hypothetical protein IH991_10400 [Planctomycetes bacterium]|nr:hypothetical protein [Planctomycetota bacterium]
MKSSSIWSAFGVISLFFASCGKDEPSADKSKQDQNLSQADQSPSYDPKTDSSDLRPTSDRGATPMDGEKHYDDQPPAVPPIPKSKLLDSIGRALLKGAENIGNE